MFILLLVLPRNVFFFSLVSFHTTVVSNSVLEAYFLRTNGSFTLFVLFTGDA